jgi:hypothetical protein
MTRCGGCQVFKIIKMGRRRHYNAATGQEDVQFDCVGSVRHTGLA